MAKRLALKSGLEELLGEAEVAYEKNLSEKIEAVIELSVDLIKPNPLQPRKKFNTESIKELAESIKEHGLLQPILVYENYGEYFLIAGERRLRASKMANLDSIRAIVADIKTDKLRELAIIENIQRENLNPIDLANSYRELLDDYGITHEELANRLKLSRAQITNTMRILDLSEFVQNLILENKITQGHAKVMVGLTEKQQEIVANSIIGQKLSVREVENLVKTIKNPESKQDSTNNNSNIVTKSNQEKKNENDLLKLCECFDKFGIKAKIQGDSILIKPKQKEILRLIDALKN